MKRYVTLIGALVVFALLVRVGINSGGGRAEMRALFAPIADIYLRAFNSPATALVLCILMVGAAVVLLLYYRLIRIGPARADIARVADELREIHARGTKEALARVDHVMNRHHLVTRGWALYRATLVEQRDGRMVSRISPARYFDMRMLEGAGLRLRFFRGLPGDFVGLGLIFTFLGLVAGLYFASESMMSADLNVARNALVLLLHAATFKFLTSITGIGLSLLLSWAQAIMIGGLRAEILELQLLVEEHFPMSVDAGAYPAPVALSGAPA